jgi:hypothetical protein
MTIRPGDKGRRLHDGDEFNDPERMEMQLLELRATHRQLDEQIEEMILSGEQAFQVMALKREKLRVKDQIVWLTAKLTPDIIA